MNAPDLTQRPPRSPRVRLGGYALLPRILDKGRATLAGKNGDYKFNCPLDQHFLSFTGIEAEALKAQLMADGGDGEILEWIQTHARHSRTAVEIAAWSAYHDQRGPGDVEGREYFSELQKQTAPRREDISSWFDLLDVDDFASFGGQP